MTVPRAAKAFAEIVGLLGEVKSTTDMLYMTLIALRERGADADGDEAFDMVCEILRLMGEGIPQRVANAILGVQCGAPQNAPTVDTIH